MKCRRQASKSLLLLASLLILSCDGSHSTRARPDGVNFGGVFVLEDWFFSPASVGHYVSTPCTDADTGIASSQIFAQSQSVPAFTWTSETNMIKQFLENGLSEPQIAELFESHRANYLRDPAQGIRSLDDNFARLRLLGIRQVRLPITWAITYPDRSYSIDPGHGRPTITVPATTDVVLIQDPFYPDLKWASIPIGEVMRVLKSASEHGVKVLLDIHAYPGGSSDGTYNGIWPLQPEFWNTGLDGGEPIYRENFRTVFQNLIAWAEGLHELADRSYARGLGGLSPMNEPAHLMGIPDARCSDGSWGIASYQNVLDTLATGVADFQRSSLPGRGVKLYMNIIETMFPTSMTSDQIYGEIGSWWQSVTTEDDRESWAVLDIHHYFAWDGSCNTCLQDYVEDGVVVKAGFDQMRKCSRDWYSTVRGSLGLESEALLATSEFSASSNSDTYASCSSGVAQPASPRNFDQYRNAVLRYQVNDAKAAGIDVYFWTWMIPYNENYQNEWALEDVLG